MKSKVAIDLARFLRADALSDDEVGLWPENRLRTLGLRDDLLQRFQDIRDGDLALDDSSKTIIDIMHFFWMQHILKLAYSQRLADRLSELKRPLDCLIRYPILWALMTDSPLPDDRYLAMLASGPPWYQKWRWPLRMVRLAVKGSRVQASPWRRVGAEGEVVTLLQGPAIERLAHQRSIRPRYCELDTWFGSIVAGSLVDRGRLADVVLDVADRATSSYGVELQPRLRDWLFRQFQTSAAFIDQHVRRLHLLTTIPSQLWIGSSSSFWPRLLAKEVLRRGGKVVAFDHGFGSGYFDGLDAPKLMRFFCCEFATFTDIQKKHIQDFFAVNAAPGGQPVTVISLGEGKGGTRAVHAAPGTRSGAGQAIMLLPLPLMGEQFNLTPYPDDWWVQDLNRRLLADLCGAGYRVLVKPHPEFDSSELAEIAAFYGAEMIEGRFEKTAYLAEAFLLTHPLSTTLQYVLENRLPTALIDFGFAPWRTAMKRHLEKDITMISGRLGHDNRLRYDGDELRRWLQSQPFGMARVEA